MTDTALEKMFAEFEAAAMVTFRPPGVAEAQRRARVRRRRRRGLLAGVVALLLGGPVGGYALADRGDRPTPAPTPTVAPSPGGKLTVRKATLPDVRGDLRQLRFVDSRAGWALFDTCASNDLAASGCVRTVARTADGGVTWQRTALPAAPYGPVELLPRDDRTLAVLAGDRSLVTVDGGATFTDRPANPPDEAALRARATPNGFLITCPASRASDPVAQVTTCAREKLFRIDDAPLPRQPPVTLQPRVDHELVEGGDNRLWVSVADGDGRTVVTTDDGGTTWTTLPAVPGAERLTVSPDGEEVWLLDVDGTKSVRRLVGDRWERRPGLPDDIAAAAAAGGGMLAVVSRYGGAGFWVNGRYIDVPELRDPLRSEENAEAGVEVLGDGTVLISYGRTQILGTGQGTQRAWTWIS